MSRSSNRGWAAFSLVGIALWVGATVLVTVLNDDPADGKPTLLTFAGGGAAFFAVVFGFAWWQTRPRTDPELDALLAELSLDPGPAPRSARAISGMRRVARAYIVLGALVTALGLAAIVQEGLGVGDPRATLIAVVVIVVAWAAAVPFVLRQARAASRAVLTPLGLTQFGDRMSGERRDRAVSVRITPRGSVTSLAGGSAALPLEGDADPRLRRDGATSASGSGVEASATATGSPFGARATRERPGSGTCGSPSGSPTTARA